MLHKKPQKLPNCHCYITRMHILLNAFFLIFRFDPDRQITSKDIRQYV